MITAGATPGPCTGTAGYISNYEINQIIADPSRGAQQYYDEISGDIVVYDSTQWVTYLKSSTYDSRMTEIQGMNFAGTVDWAMDLDADAGGGFGFNGTGDGYVALGTEVYASADPTVFCQPPCTFCFPPWTLSDASTIFQSPITVTVEDMFPVVTTDGNGITGTETVHVTITTTVILPPVVTNVVSVWDVTWTDASDTILYLTSSIMFPAVTLTHEPITVTSGGSSTTVGGGYLWTYSPGPYPSYTPPAGGTINPPPPPPPPPSGSQNGGGSVKPKRGSPGPGCKFPQICNTPCIVNCLPKIPCTGVCGCIGPLCPPGQGGCVGFGCNGGRGDGDDGNNEECTSSATVTDCEVACSVAAPANGDPSTTCYTTSCGTFTLGCGATGTTVTTGLTEACSATAPYSLYYANDGQIAMFDDGPDGGYWLQQGTWTLNTPTAVASGPADPTPGPGTIQIFAHEITGCGGASCSTSWSFDVFVEPAAVNLVQADVCGSQAIYDQFVQFTTEPNYPTSLGPFNVFSHTNCYYTADGDVAVGFLTCDDATFTCQAYADEADPGTDGFTACSDVYDRYSRRLICPYSKFSVQYCFNLLCSHHPE